MSNAQARDRMKVPTKQFAFLIRLIFGLLTLPLVCRAAIWEVDSTFSPALEGNSFQRMFSPLAVRADGSLVTYVNASVVGGVAVTSSLVRIKADGSVDRTYVSAVVGSVKAAYPDGRLVVLVLRDRSTSTYSLERLMANGAIDPTFVPVFVTDDYFSVQILPDGRLLMWGGQFRVQGIWRLGLAMLMASGGLDPTFTSPITDTSAVVRAVTPSSDGLSFWITGSNLALGTGRNAVARVFLSGSVDPSFAVADSAGITGGTAIFAPTGGRLLVANSTPTLVALVATTGATDSSFSANPIGTVKQFGPNLYGGKILYLTTIAGGPTQRQLRRMNIDGTDDATFAAVTTPDSAAYAVTIPTIGADGDLYFGPVTADRYAGNIALTRVKPTGMIDAVYAPRSSATFTVNSYVRLSNGKYLVAGTFAYVNGGAVPAGTSLIRLNADGSTDSGFSAPTFSVAPAGIYLQPDGKILLTGVFPEVGSAVTVVRLKTDGSLDAAFHPLTNVASLGTRFGSNLTVDGSGYIYAIHLDNAIVIRRYAPDGQADPSFVSDSSLAGPIRLFCATTDGDIIISRSSGSSSQLVRLTHTGAVRGVVNYSYTNSDILGVAPLPSGDAIVLSTQATLRVLIVARTKVSGPATYFYTKYDPFMSSGLPTTDEDILDVAGVMLDLFQADSPSGSNTVNITFGVPTYAPGPIVCVGTNGMAEISGGPFSGGGLAQFRRTGTAGPSVSNPAPYFYYTNGATASPYHVDLDSSPLLSPQRVGGIGPVYSWYHDGALVAGQTAPTISISHVQGRDAGVYTLQASNAYGTAVSSPIELIVDGLAPLVFTSQPTSQTVAAGSAVTFTAAATSGASITFAWRRNGVPISGATANTLSLSRVTEGDNGAVFDVVARSNGVSYTSSSATLTVTPVATRIFFGNISAGGSFALYVTASGAATMIGELPNGRGGFIVQFSVNSDGAFSATLAPVGGSQVPLSDSGTGRKIVKTASLALSGTLQGSTFSATSSAGDSFSATAQAANGPTAAISGLYQAPVLYSSVAAITFIVGTNGSVMALPVNYASGQAVAGTVAADGTFVLDLGGAGTLRGTIDARGGISGRIVSGSAPIGAFGGISSTTTHTDRLVNISTRGLAGDGEQSLIAGFVVAGDVPKPVLIRAIGPTLASYGLTGTMDNPILAIVRGTDVLATNDDWVASTDAALLASTAARLGAFSLNAGSKDAAVITTLAPGIYSAKVTRASGSQTGLALVEVYDASINPGTDAQKLVNISTRGQVGTGDNLMIAGLVITGNAPKTVLIRGVGPTLGSYGVSATLANPILKLYQGDTLVASNDDWETNAAAAQILTAAAQVGAFPLAPGSKDAALLLSLAPGVYSAQVAGVGGSTGIALLEVYEIP